MVKNNYTYPILYTFRRCPFAIRARLTLAYSSISVELKEISLKNRPSELFAVSPKGTVPVLCLNNHTIIDESLEIMKWALHHNDPESWIGHNKQIQLEMIAKYDNEFKYWLDRYKYYDRYPEKDQYYYRNKCDQYLSKLNIALEDNRYILSNHICLIDIAILPFVRQFANVDKKWFKNNYLYIYRWLNNLIKSKLFLSVMHKYPEYTPEQKPLLINFNK